MVVGQQQWSGGGGSHHHPHDAAPYPTQFLGLRSDLDRCTARQQPPSLGGTGEQGVELGEGEQEGEGEQVVGGEQEEQGAAAGSRPDAGA